MPRLRLLADTAQAQASAISGQDVSGNPVFDVGAGDLTQISLDATAWAGADSVDWSAWDSPDGLVVSDAALTGAVASCTAAVPDTGLWPWQRMFRLRNALKLSSGPVRHTTLWLRAMAR